MRTLSVFVRVCPCLLFLLALGVAQAAPPNMVIYIADDHSQFDAGVYGAADIPTPNFEKLAEVGMLFDNAYIASPACAPSRGAMLTGLMPARNGAEGNHTFPREGVPSLIENLKALGFETVSVGKVSHGNQAARFGFDVILGPSSYPEIRETVTKFLAERTSQKPLCLFVGIGNPHVPWPMESTFDPAQITFPPTHLDTPSTRRHRAGYYQEIKEVDQFMGELRGLAAKHLGENVLFIYTADHGGQWPFGKWTLYDYGIRVPFIVSWPGVVEAGSQSSAMISWVDLIPTLLELGGGKAPEGLDGRSFAAVLRGETSTHRDRIFTTHTGDKRMNVYPSRSVRTSEWKLIHNLHPEFAFTNHSDILRIEGSGAYWTEWAELAKTDAHAKQIVDRYYRRPEFELYHVSEDKWEQTNLADNPEYAEILADLKAELETWQREQGDTFPVLDPPRLLADPASWNPDFFGPDQQK